MAPESLFLRISIVGLLFLALAASAFAQGTNVQQELIRRQQQSDDFSQQLRQSVERAKVPPGDLKGQQKIETRQLDERHQLENLDQQQLQRASQPGTPPEAQPQERGQMEQERRRLVEPPPGEGQGP
ncbi:MAG TPA: hypothetical protein VEI82_02035 [Myxococcota bacterium]|nr:hypothetical protein [Burkholderiales bacterium]HXZ84245.1 hypothetical protein [Myxococcota bacterium]